MNILKPYLFMIFPLISGCQNLNTHKDSKSFYVESTSSSSTLKHIVGTQFPFNDKYDITAAHVTHEMDNKDRIVSINKQCDVALLYKNRNRLSTEKFANSKLKDTVTVFGYVGTKKVIISGKIIGYKTISFGQFTQNCNVALVDFKAKKGMSGAPVYNSKNEIIGVNFATDKEKNISYIVPYESFKVWLKEQK